MPSFSEAMGIIVTFIVLSMASRHGDVVWKAITDDPAGGDYKCAVGLWLPVYF